MPRHDLYHDVVKRALVKEGWTITDDPLLLKFDDSKLYLAVAHRVHRDFLLRPAVKEFIGQKQIRLLVFRPDTEEIVLWTN